jgi:Taurine catabolism dioxygenase TauD, TfdA family
LFAENYVMLHTELAVKPVENQPRYIILHCIEPPRYDDGGQTILARMDDVRHALNERQAAIMLHTRHAGHASAPQFLRRCGTREIFAFKDVGGRDLPWCYQGDDRTVTPEDVNAAIATLLSALYEPAGIVGFHWKRWTLGAIDNTRFFHGRTFVHRPAKSRARHLRRVRISTAEPFTEEEPWTPSGQTQKRIPSGWGAAGTVHAAPRAEAWVPSVPVAPLADEWKQRVGTARVAQPHHRDGAPMADEPRHRGSPGSCGTVRGGARPVVRRDDSSSQRTGLEGDSYHDQR